jgi:hypothetical protein
MHAQSDLKLLLVLSPILGINFEWFLKCLASIYLDIDLSNSHYDSVPCGIFIKAFLRNEHRTAGGEHS